MAKGQDCVNTLCLDRLGYVTGKNEVDINDSLG